MRVFAHEFRPVSFPVLTMQWWQSRSIPFEIMTVAWRICRLLGDNLSIVRHATELVQPGCSNTLLFGVVTAAIRTTA